MDKPHDNSETGCCPRFDPRPWDEQETTFQDKLFLKDRVRSLFHIPLNFGRVMVRSMAKIEAADALAPEPLLLCDENSLWGADVHIAVTKEVPGAQMVRISGTFLCKVFEGPFKNIRTWLKQMEDFVQASGKQFGQLYFFYTTCPRCAKHYGKNYVVILAKV